MSTQNKPNTTNSGTSTEGTKLVISKTPVAEQAASITVNAGVAGNIKKLVLDGGKSWTVREVLQTAGFDSNGYEIRMSGEPVKDDAIVTDGRTILLLRPVVGN
ncbi:MAG: hypothetical protein K2W95_10175 [Candidatus Obscuribacterales bacterium]|nr:hypothetical protein [Candidatus Obscuribacterales bacterium]